uniref:Uncharacterized protein n=1 Tax=Lygus hesperus TaxID=30085 RepID=A0A0A9Z1E4_LYGHE
MFMILFNLTLSFLVNFIVVSGTDEMFQFKTIKPKLYPFEATYSATDPEEGEYNTESVADYKNVDPNDLAWMVVVLEASRVDTEVVLRPVCLGIVITTIDVLTTCTCMRLDKVNHMRTTFVVKPKTNIVHFDNWDNDLLGVTNVRYHDSCLECSNTSYNDLVILTVQIIDVIHGIVEPIPKSAYMKDTKKKTKSKIYKHCYIVVVEVIESDYSESPKEFLLERRHFTVWDVPSPKNHLNTRIIVGRSNDAFEDSELYKRYHGAPLICEDETNQQVPVGIYLGLECADINQEELKRECSRWMHECDDCFPTGMSLNYTASQCEEMNLDFVEIAIHLNSFFEWLDEFTFELPGDVYVPFQKSLLSNSNRKID